MGRKKACSDIKEGHGEPAFPAIRRITSKRTGEILLETTSMEEIDVFVSRAANIVIDTFFAGSYVDEQFFEGEKTLICHATTGKLPQA